MAILANNDTRTARFAHPPLSVIPMPGQLMGLEAMKLLDFMIRIKLNRLFKKPFGKTPVKAIHEERLARIHHWLCDTDLTISRISKLNGFGNIFHFCRFFKRVAGMTPTKYRATHCRKPDSQK